MAIINTLVAKSANVSAAALNLNDKAFQIRQTIAGVWDLKPSISEAPESVDAFSLDMKNDSVESVVDGDERIKVPEKDFMPGGKYRSIVKLFIHYEFQQAGKWAMGTGWLIKPDLLVTAGHCTYDWGHKLGRATEVKAYIGYKGNGSIKDPSVQFRTGKRIVTTEGWLKTRGSKPFDVGFIQVNQPFTGIVPIKYEETPRDGQLNLGVVGYPGDLQDKRTGEKGAFMYEMFCMTDYNLAEQPDTMLEYQIDTFGGNSGSPVLRQSDLASIGAHVYGGANNSASVIGRHGNPYNDYVAAFGLQVPNDGLNLVRVIGPAAVAVPSSGQAKGTAAGQAPILTHSGLYLNGSQSTHTGYQGTSNGYHGTPNGSSTARRTDLSRSYPVSNVEDEEGFFEFMKGAVRVGGPLLGSALKAGLPLALGPLGGPIGALAGLALNAAGKLAESADAESGFDLQTIHEGTIERAILAEAAFTAIQEMDLHPEDEESIFSDMKDYIVKAAPTIQKVAPRIMGAMMEPALRIAMDSLHKYNEKGLKGAEALEDEGSEPFRHYITYSSEIDQRGDRNTEAFVSGLQKALSQGQEAFDEESEEGFFDVIKAGCRLGIQGLSFAAKTGLPILVQALDAESAGAESVEATSDGLAGLSSKDLARRAVAGEAALQALMKLPAQRLQEEGFFETIASVVKKITPIVIKVAPGVINSISPTVGRIIQAATSQEPRLRKASPRLPMNRKKSQPALRKKESANDFLGKVQQSRVSSRR